MSAIHVDIPKEGDNGEAWSREASALHRLRMTKQVVFLLSWGGGSLQAWRRFQGMHENSRVQDTQDVVDMYRPALGMPWLLTSSTSVSMCGKGASSLAAPSSCPRATASRASLIAFGMAASVAVV